MSNGVMEQIDFVELMKRHSERNIPWCNMTCKTASISTRRYYWSGKYSDLGNIIARQNDREIMFECLYVSRNKRIKEIAAMGYEIESVCETWDGEPQKWDKIYFIAKRKEAYK